MTSGRTIEKFRKKETNVNGRTKSSTLCESKDNKVTPNASNTWFRITIWQQQDDGNTNLTAYGSRYLKETKKVHHR